MSRSYKKTPSCHIAKPDKSRKKEYNRKLRRCKKFDDMPNGKSYCKANESWCINDWHEVGTSYQRFKAWQVRWGSYEDEKQCREEYERYYLRK